MNERLAALGKYEVLKKEFQIGALKFSAMRKEIHQQMDVLLGPEMENINLQEMRELLRSMENSQKDCLDAKLKMEALNEVYNFEY